MADTAGQWHALIWLLWPAPQAAASRSSEELYPLAARALVALLSSPQGMHVATHEMPQLLALVVAVAHRPIGPLASDIEAGADSRASGTL